MMNSRTATPWPAYRFIADAVLHHPAALVELAVDLDPGARLSGQVGVIKHTPCAQAARSLRAAYAVVCGPLPDAELEGPLEVGSSSDEAPARLTP